jgi:hypothetical protein
MIDDLAPIPDLGHQGFADLASGGDSCYERLRVGVMNIAFAIFGETIMALKDTRTAVAEHDETMVIDGDDSESRYGPWAYVIRSCEALIPPFAAENT